MGKEDKGGFSAKGTALRSLDEAETHESYGMVGLSRCTGGNQHLFGSSIRSHGHFISLEVRRAKRMHDLSRDWYMSDGRVPLIEVHLSAAQFAEMITTMNVGDGVPCTIRYLGADKMENPPDVSTEAEKVQTGFKEHTEELAQKMDRFQAEMRTLFEKKSLGKRDREEILKQIGLFIQSVRSDLPFVLESFEEATEKVVTTAKAEVEAFTTSAVQAAGLEAIADGRFPKALTEGSPKGPGELPGED